MKTDINRTILIITLNAILNYIELNIIHKSQIIRLHKEDIIFQILCADREVGSKCVKSLYHLNTKIKKS